MEGREGKEKQLRKSQRNKIIFAQPDPLFHPTLTACTPSCRGIGNNWELVFSSKYWTICEQLVNKWHMEEPKHGKQARGEKSKQEKEIWMRKKDENVDYSDKGRKDSATEGKNIMNLDRERNEKSGMPESMNVRPGGRRGVWRHSHPGVTINTAPN